MKEYLAWCNVSHDKRRTLAAVSGVAFAILLVFMQLGFYSACQTSSTMVYDTLDFDAILTSELYVHLRYCGSIPRTRIYQAQGVAGVHSATGVHVSTAMWRNVATRVRREILVLGVNPSDRPFRVSELNRHLYRLIEPDTAIIDQLLRPILGPHAVGTTTEVNGRRIEVLADYRRGAGLIADGTLVVSDLTMSHLQDAPLDQIQLGLLRFDPGVDRYAVAAELRARLPSDTRVWLREQLEEHEQHFFMRIKPVGFMFTSGLFVGLVVGAVILYQILSADIAAHTPQYAALKAIGFGHRYLYRLVITQGLLFALLGYFPALIVSVGLYAVVRALADLPMQLTLGRMALVLALSVGMCTLSGLLAIRKVNAADPADLF